MGAGQGTAPKLVAPKTQYHKAAELERPVPCPITVRLLGRPVVELPPVAL